MHAPSHPDDDVSELNRSLRRLAQRLVGDASAAEDVVQEAWLTSLSKHGPSFANRRRWLWLATRFKAKEYLRAKRSRLARERRGTRNASTPSAADVVADNLLARALREAVAELPEPFATVVRLRFFEELSFEDIAQELGRPVSTVRAQSGAGLERLRARLDARYGSREKWLPAALAWTSREPRMHAATSASALVASFWWLSIAASLVALVSWGWWSHREQNVELTQLETPSEPRLSAHATLESVPDRNAPEAGEVAGGRADLSVKSSVADVQPAAASTAPAKQESAPLRVHVVEAGGIGVPQADVKLVIENNTKYTLLGHTDESGWFEGELSPDMMSAITPRSLGVYDRPALTLRADGFAYPGTFIPPWDPVRGASLQIEIERAVAPTTVLIEDMDGNPLPEARIALTTNTAGVVLEQPDGTSLIRNELWDSVDRNGCCRIVHQSPAQSVLLAIAPGHLQAWVILDVLHTEPTEVEVRLAPCPVVRGVVRDAHGAVVEKAKVWFEPIIGLPLSTVSDARGRYEIELRDRGSIRLWARHPAHPTWVAIGNVDSNTGTDLTWDPTLEPRQGLRVRVVDHSDHPVKDCKLSVRRSRNNTEISEPADLFSLYERTLLTDAEGFAEVFELVDGDLAVDAVMPGWNSEVACASLDPIRAGDEEHRIQLPDLSAGPASLVATLHSANETERSGLQALLFSRNLQERFHVPIEPTTGRVLVENLPPGTYWIIAGSQERGAVEYGPFTLQAGEHKDLGELAIPAVGFVSIDWTFPKDAREIYAEIALDVMRGKSSLSPTSVVEFTAPRGPIPLYPGHYHVVAERDGVKAVWQCFEVVSGATVIVELGPEVQHRTTLRVLAPDRAKSPSRVHVSISNSETAAIPVDADAREVVQGVFELDLRLPEGSYKVIADADDGRTAEFALELRETADELPVHAATLH